MIEIKDNNDVTQEYIIELQDVKAWIGSDTTRDEIIEIILDIANYNYNRKQLKQDILDYFDLDYKGK